MLQDTGNPMHSPDIERWSERVVVVRGLNPGVFTGPGTNTYLVGTGPRPILIDTGSGAKLYPTLLRDALEREFGCDRPSEILVTHAHPDHLGGVASLFEAFGVMPVSKRPWPGRDAGIALTTLDEGDVVETEGASLRALHCPGHAEDHLCFVLEEERAVFTGDNVLGYGTTVIPIQGGDMGDYLKSLSRLRELAPSRIYPGHGPLVLDPRERLEYYIEHRLERERQVVATLREGALRIVDMVERIYVDTDRSLYPAAGQSVLSHLRKLQDELRVVAKVDAGGETYWSLR